VSDEHVLSSELSAAACPSDAARRTHDKLSNVLLLSTNPV
jgi:hypothetical protein